MTPPVNPPACNMPTTWSSPIPQIGGQPLPFCSGEEKKASARETTSALFAKKAKFTEPLTPKEKSWLKIVNGNRGEINLYSDLMVIAKAFKLTGLKYARKSPRVEDIEPEPLMSLIYQLGPLSLSKTLEEKSGDCVPFSALVAATLLKLGYKPVIIYNLRHATTGVLSKNPEEGKLKGIPIKPKGQKGGETIFLYPFDPTALVKEKDVRYNFENAIKAGYDFVKPEGICKNDFWISLEMFDVESGKIIDCAPKSESPRSYWFY